jgi:XRE family transcriptional regulator, regulator of sulfur utilization
MARAYDEVITQDTTADPSLAQFAEAAKKHFEAAYTLAFGLGEQLAASRIAQGLSQTELAARAGVPQADISRIERGKGNPTLSTLERVLNALHLQISLHPVQ